MKALTRALMATIVAVGIWLLVQHFAKLQMVEAVFVAAAIGLVCGLAIRRLTS